MQRILALFIGIGFILSGCSGTGGSVSPDLPVDSGDIPGAQSANGAGDLLVGNFRVSIDPSSLEATVTTPRLNQSQPPQNLNYDLDIGNFINPYTLEAIGVRIERYGDLTVTFRHRHPFRAPNVAAPITAGNRADLSYTGRLLILADEQVESVDVGGDTIAFDPYLAKNAQGYVHPGDLLLETGLAANTFPYFLLVDEAQNNREGVSNGLQATGNYDPGAGGWQRGNIGDGNGWTGYSYLHAGQSTIFDIRLDREALESGNYTFDTAFLIQYTDPRGTGTKNFRMPFDPADPAQFAYRLPHAALDCEAMATPCGDIYINENDASSTPLSVFLRDWDTGATEAADGDLSDETDVGLVLPGSSAMPTMEFVAPQVTSTLALAHQGGTGVAADEFRFGGVDLNNNAAAAPGTYWGLFVATDPQDADPNASSYRFGVDPNTLDADPARALRVRTFLPARINVAPNSSWVRLIGGRASERPAKAQIDSNGNIIVLTDFWGDATDFAHGECEDIFGAEETSHMALVQYDQFGNQLGYRTWQAPGFFNMEADTFTLDSNDNVYIAFLFYFTPGLDLDPGPGTDFIDAADSWWGAIVSLDAAGNYRYGHRFLADFIRISSLAISEDNHLFLSGGVTSADPVDMDGTEGVDPFDFSDLGGSFFSKYGTDGTYVWTRAWDDAGIGDIALSSTRVYGGSNFSEQADFDPGPGEDIRTPSGDQDAILMEMDLDGNYIGAQTWGGIGFSRVTAFDIVRNPAGALFVSGHFEGTIDFDPGPGESDIFSNGQRDVFVSFFDNSLTWNQTLRIGNGGEDFFANIACDPAGDILLSNIFTGTMDFDPTAGTDERTSINQDPYIVKLGADGSFQWATTLPGDSSSFINSLAVGDNGIYVGGATFGMLDFDPGPGIVEPQFLAGNNPLFLLRLAPDGTW